MNTEMDTAAYVCTMRGYTTTFNTAHASRLMGGRREQHEIGAFACDNSDIWHSTHSTTIIPKNVLNNMLLAQFSLKFICISTIYNTKYVNVHMHSVRVVYVRRTE